MRAELKPPPLVPAARAIDRTDRAYQQIREAILTMALQPGQQLQENGLAEWLGTSRTPVREALRRLQAEGLIDRFSARGAVVAQVSIDDVENAYLVLEVLEALASRLAAERISDDGAARLRHLIGRMRDAAAAGALDTWTKVDGEFHDAIREYGANPKLSQVATITYSTIERVRSTYLRDGSESERLARAAADHAELGEAIAARDSARAEALTRQLFAKARVDNVRLLRHWVEPLRRSF